MTLGEIMCFFAAVEGRINRGAAATAAAGMASCLFETEKERKKKNLPHSCCLRLAVIISEVFKSNSNEPHSMQ